MSTLSRTPPKTSTTANSNTIKRIRSEDDAAAHTQPLTLEAVMQAMNLQFAKTIEQIQHQNCLIQSISGKIDTVKAELESKLDAVSKDVSTIKAECAAKFKCNEDAICVLNEKVESVSREIDGLAMRNELIISGIPHLKEENLVSYFKAMWKHVGLRESDLQPVDIRRLKSGAKSEPLVLLQFALRNNRDDFYSSYLRTRDLNLRHLGIDSNRRVYVNENLVVAARKLKAAALQLKKSGKLSSVYTRMGVVHVKRSTDEQPVVILKEDQLAHFS